MKTFKSATTPNSRLLRVENLDDKNLHLRIVGDVNTRTTISIAPSDAPALALAILEAAGFKAEFHAAGTFQDGDCWQLENVAQVIKDYLSIKGAEAAEAKEQAELEAEALELYNARILFLGGDALTSFEKLNQDNKDMWLAVARKAREMRAEK